MGPVIHITMESVAGECDFAKPQMLYDITLPERFLDLKIMLPRDRVPQCHDKNAYGAPRLMHRSFHCAVMLPHAEHLRLYSRLEVFAGQGMIRSRVTRGSHTESACQDGGKKWFHGF